MELLKYSKEEELRDNVDLEQCAEFKALVKQGGKQIDFAEKYGYTYQYINNLCNGQQKVQKRHLVNAKEWARQGRIKKRNEAMNGL